jgi:hypothetical protein
MGYHVGRNSSMTFVCFCFKQLTRVVTPRGQATCRKKGALMLCGNIANEAQCIKIFQSVANVTTFWYATHLSLAFYLHTIVNLISFHILPPSEFPEAVYDRVELGWKPLPNRGSSIDGDDSFFDSLVKKFKSLFS